MAKLDTVLRPARREDAAALADLAARSFAATFAAMTPPADLEEFLRTTYGEAQQAAEIADPEVRTVLAWQGDTLVGFLQVRPGDPPPCVAATGALELGRIYVDGPAHGAGVGNLLMREALDIASDQGARVLWLGVFQFNERAIRFYRRWGFVPVGEHVFHVGNDAQRDLILLRVMDTDAADTSPAR